MRPSGGGRVVALVGGDGAGKSTCARALASWLGSDMPTLHAHLGKPPRGPLTLLIGAALKAEALGYRLARRARPNGTYIELLRHLCTAYDRHRLYQRVRRYAVAGGIAICERYPVPENRVLVGPCIPELSGPEPTRVVRFLRDLELRFYERMLPPDTVFVLQLDPEIAVLRKTDEPSDYVRARAQVIWKTDWTRTSAQVIDASRPVDDVVEDLKDRIWSVL
jgi:thymidylate kinase